MSKAKELAIDLFAGGGGASTGIELAIGKYVDDAINHDPEALGMHEVNHPQTRHHCTDIFEIDPLSVTDGNPVGLLWASPDCKHFSKAKGGKPVSKRIRSLAWVVVKWAKSVRPRTIFVENVEEFKTWGPLKNNYPDPERKGETFNKWVNALKGLGYKIEWRELRACDYGAPTIRKRLFIIARRDNLPIVWPKPTHGDPKKAETKKKGLLPWRTAAECIDWSLPCPSIFERSKPLADNTLRRIAHGIMKYVINNPEPFIVQVNHTESDGFRGQKTKQARTSKEPLSTVLVTAFLEKQFGKSIGQNLKKPLGSVTSIDKHHLMTAHVAKHFTGAIGSDLKKPVGTVTSIDHNSLVTSHITKLRGTNIGHGADEPLHTVSAQGTHMGEVRALLIKYHGNEKDGLSLFEPMSTITTKDRLGLVTVMIKGEPYVITDIGMRMLQPHELYAAQGFPEGYIFDMTSDGKEIKKTGQVRMCGNSVCPDVAEAVVKANHPIDVKYFGKRKV